MLRFINRRQRIILSTFIFSIFASNAWAGPPYITDDPEPTDYKHYEIYAFHNYNKSLDGSDSTNGIDFNYGGFKNVQLTAVLPWVTVKPKGEQSKTGFGQAELAVKYKFMNQEKDGINAAFFPRVYLPAKNENFGSKQTQLLLPIFIGYDFKNISTFGGGGCVYNHGGDSKNFCNLGVTATTHLNKNLQIGAELFSETADTKGGKNSGGYGLGATYDINNNLHLLVSYNDNLLNKSSTYKNSFYISLLTTY